MTKEKMLDYLPKRPAASIERKTLGKGSRITNDEVTDFICDFYKSPSKELAWLREYGEINNVPIILKETEIYLNTLLEMISPKKILEIGTAIGYSSIYFATKCKSATIYTVEKDENVYKEAKDIINFFEKGENIISLKGDGEEVIKKLNNDGNNDFDLIFIDAAKSHYLRFFKEAIKVAKKGSVIISDNVLMHGMTVYYDVEKYRKHRTNVKKMREYLDIISKDENLETSILAIGDGMSISIVK